MSLGRIIIRDASTQTATVGKNGFEVTSQHGFFEKPNGERLALNFGVEKGKPWPAGEYDLSGDSLHVDRYGRLEIKSQLVLIPVGVQKVKVA